MATNLTLEALLNSNLTQPSQQSLFVVIDQGVAQTLTVQRAGAVLGIAGSAGPQGPTGPAGVGVGGQLTQDLDVNGFLIKRNDPLNSIELTGTAVNLNTPGPGSITNQWHFSSTGTLQLPTTSTSGILFPDGTFQQSAYSTASGILNGGVLAGNLNLNGNKRTRYQPQYNA
jgi:hypothetical protein